MIKLRQMKGLRRGVCLVLALVLLATACPWVFVNLGNTSYSRGDYVSSARYFSFASRVSWYDKDIPYTDYGNALFKQSKYEQAIVQYDKATSFAPVNRRCNIRFNWALSLVQLAEKTVASDKKKALAYYAEALRVLSAEECSNDEKAQAEAEYVKQQIQDLSKASQSQAKQKPTDSKSAEDKLKDDSQEQKQRSEFNNQKAYEENKSENDKGNYDFAY